VWIVAYAECEGLQGHDKQQTKQTKTLIGSGENRDAPNTQSIGQPRGGMPDGARDESADQQGRDKSRGEVEQHLRQWSTEPDVGGRLDGFSLWLDGFDLTHSHELLLTYGEKNKVRPVEILRSLWCSVRTEENRNSTRRSKCISSEEVLFAYVCKLKERATDKAWVQLQGKTTSQEKVSSMRPHEKSSCSSYRSEYKKQQEKQHTDTLQTLSQLLAHHAEKAWIAYRRKNANSLLTWECGISRVAHGIPNRVDRLRSLGNAIVPQVAYQIMKGIHENIRFYQ
jgi:hypothetical protein